MEILIICVIVLFLLVGPHCIGSSSDQHRSYSAAAGDAYDQHQRDVRQKQQHACGAYHQQREERQKQQHRRTAEAARRLRPMGW